MKIIYVFLKKIRLDSINKNAKYGTKRFNQTFIIHVLHFNNINHYILRM